MRTSLPRVSLCSVVASACLLMGCPEAEQVLNNTLDVEVTYRKPIEPDSFPSSGSWVAGAYRMVLQTSTQTVVTPAVSTLLDATVDEGDPSLAGELRASEQARLRLEVIGNDGQTVNAKGRSSLFSFGERERKRIDVFLGTRDTFSNISDEDDWARSGASAAVLSDGRILIVGGQDNDIADNAMREPMIYDHVTGTTEEVTVSGGDNAGLKFATVIALNNGRALVAGGRDSSLTTRSDLWLFETTTGASPTHTLTKQTHDVHPHYAACALHAPTDGSSSGNEAVYIFGGIDGAGNAVDTVTKVTVGSELTTSAHAETLTVARGYAACTPITGLQAASNGVVLSGGLPSEGSNSAIDSLEQWDFINGPLEPLPQSPVGMGAGRVGHIAVKYPDSDKILLHGGGSSASNVLGSATTEYYDVISEEVVALNLLSDAELRGPRLGAMAAPLPDGNILIHGGTGQGPGDETSVIFDVVEEDFIPTAPVLNTLSSPVRTPLARVGGVALQLFDHSVLFFGGNPNAFPQANSLDQPVSGAEIFTPYCDGDELEYPSSERYNCER